MTNFSQAMLGFSKIVCIFNTQGLKHWFVLNFVIKIEIYGFFIIIKLVNWLYKEVMLSGVNYENIQI